MKIVFLNGSARNNGNTNYLLQKIVEKLDDSIYTSSTINISDNMINYCLGCHECEKTRVCVQNDDMNSIYNEFFNSDIICIASPSYWGYVTGQLKVFFDRSTPYCNTIDGKTSFPSSKKAIAISIRAGSSESENIEIINSIEHYFSHLEIEPIFNLSLKKITKKVDFNTEENQHVISTFVSNLNKWGQNHLRLNSHK